MEGVNFDNKEVGARAPETETLRDGHLERAQESIVKTLEEKLSEVFGRIEKNPYFSNISERMMDTGQY